MKKVQFYMLLLSMLIGVLDSLAHAQTARYCVGEKVVAEHTYDGTVVQKNTNGTVDVRWDVNEIVSNWKIQDLTTRVTNVNGYRVGERLVSNNGTIESAYSDGTVDVKWDIEGPIRNWKTKDLSRTKSIGKQVRYQGETGVIVHPNANGTFDVRWQVNGAVSKSMALKEFSLAVASKNGISADESVFSNDGYKGKVLSVFSDGTADVMWEVNGLTSNWRTQDLAKVMDCAPESSPTP